MGGVKVKAARLFYVPTVIREALSAFPDVVPMLFRAGQILVYPHHTPPGVFVVLGGALRRFEASAPGDRHTEDRLDAGERPFATPGPGELSRPAGAGVLAETDVEVLFVPRSVALRDGSLARLFAIAGVPVLQLQNGRAR